MTELQSTQRKSLTVKAIVGLLLAVVMVAALAAAGSAENTGNPRSGALHVTKECSQYTGLPGGFCTITGSNLHAIKAGMKVIYASAPVFPTLDSDLVLDGPGNNDAHGHVTLDLKTFTGVVTFSGGTGRFSGFHASVAVTCTTAGTPCAWDGRYSFTPVVTVLNDTALGGLGSGSTIGPDGALYVTNGNDGTLVRIDPTTGSETVVGSGLPPRTVGIGGAMDVVFIGHRAYVLVTLAGADVGVPDAVMGIYRLKRDGTFSVFADLGTWSAAHPPADPDWFLSQGVQYSLEVWRDGFVVADAHLGRVIRVDLRGGISELVAFDSTDSVPTGLEVANGKVFVATAGPIPHLPSTSDINEVRRNGSVKVVGEWGADYAGDRGLIVDVEKGRHHRLYGLLQGHWDLEPISENEGLPAAPNTGEVVAVGEDGTFETVVSGLDRPTSLELVGRVGFVVTVTGTILRIDGF